MHSHVASRWSLLFGRIGEVPILLVEEDGRSLLTTPQKRNADYKLCSRIKQDAMLSHLADRNCATYVDLAWGGSSYLGMRMSVGLSSW